MLSLSPVVPAPLAGCCTVLSVFAVVILAAFGYLFDHNAEALMGSTADPESGHAVAVTCYGAAVMYLVCIVLCGCQMAQHRRYPRGVQL